MDKNTLIRKWNTLTHTPRIFWKKFAGTKVFDLLPDKMALQIIYHNIFLKKLNLKNPQTFNEKLQWIKLYDRKPEYTTMVDKYLVRSYVKEKIGEEHLIPLLGVWDNPEDIDFDSLPDQFVLKCNHGSGCNIICKDKSQLDRSKAIEQLKQWMQTDYYKIGREWPYKNVKRKILAEKYIVDESGYELKDYKFFCFDGFAKALFIATDRQSEDEDTKFDFFDMEFNHLPFVQGHPNATKEIKRPESFERMRTLAEKLSEGIPHVRVDFYDVNGEIYFGELTFFSYSGFMPFEPEKWDYTFGSWITVPNESGGGT